MSRMKTTYLAALCTIFLAPAAWSAVPPKPATAAATPPAAAPAAASVVDIYQHLVAPELVVRLGAQVGIDAAVIESIRTEIMNLRPKLEEAQQKLRADTAALDALVRLDRPDAPACLAQLDKVLADEAAIKRLNLGLALTVKGKLTPQQIEQLKQLRDKLLAAGGGAAGGIDGAPATLRAKMQEVQALAQKRLQEGRDLAEVRKLMQDARTAAQDGKFKESEAALDQILKLLN